jgi:hypothetical protein
MLTRQQCFICTFWVIFTFWVNTDTTAAAVHVVTHRLQSPMWCCCPPAEACSRSRWYGKQRPQLPAAVGGCQPHLLGAVAGDYGFDPLKLSEQPQQFDKYFEAELLHARFVVCGQASALLLTHASISTKTCGCQISIVFNIDIQMHALHVACLVNVLSLWSQPVVALLQLLLLSHPC